MSDTFKSDNAAIEIKGLSYIYHGEERPAIEDINLAIAGGEKVGIAGPNGAGKSTLLTHLNGIKTGKGEIAILGKRIRKENIKFVRKNVGLVFQDPDDQLFCPTVFEDVAFGPLNLGLDKEQIKEKVVSALDAVGMTGYEKKSAFHLSFGEKKRIALATVLSMEPEILVFDEPSSNLDPRRRRMFIDHISSFQRTLIIASHDLDLLLDVCDRVVILDGGHIVADGAAATILRDKSLLESHDLELPLSLQPR